MANVTDPSPEHVQAWDAWVSERPTAVREVIQKYDLKPWRLYRLKGSGQRVLLYSVDAPEDGSPPTLQVDVLGRFNLVAFDRRVFGVAPEDLEECDLPSSGSVGTVLTPDEAEAAVEGVAPGEPRAAAIMEATVTKALRGLRGRAKGKA